MINVLNTGSGVAHLRIYTGSQPASADSAAAGTLLVTIILVAGWSNDGAQTTYAPVGGTAGTAIGTGSAGWGRLSDPDDLNRIDGTVGTSGTEFIIDSTIIGAGMPVKLLTCAIGQPET